MGNWQVRNWQTTSEGKRARYRLWNEFQCWSQNQFKKRKRCELLSTNANWISMLNETTPGGGEVRNWNHFSVSGWIWKAFAYTFHIRITDCIAFMPIVRKTSILLPLSVENCEWRWHWHCPLTERFLPSMALRRVYNKRICRMISR